MKMKLYYGSIKYCNYCFLNYTTLFIVKKVFALPPACHSRLPLCPKPPLLAAILRQQQVENIIKKKYNNHNTTILYANILIEVHWFEQPPMNNWNTFHSFTYYLFLKAGWCINISIISTWWTQNVYTFPFIKIRQCAL